MELMHNYPIAQILVIAMLVVLSYLGVGKRRKRPKPVVSIWYARYPLNKYDIPTVLNKVTDSSTYVLNRVYFNSDKKHIYIYVKAYTEDEATAAARSQVDVYKKTTVHRELIYEHITLPAQDPRLRATATGHSHMITVADLRAALSGTSEADSRYHSIYPMGVNEGSAASSTRTDHDHTVIGVDQGGPDPVIEGVNITYTFREKECKPKKNIGRDLVIFTK